MLVNLFLVNRGFRKFGSRFNSCYYFSPLLNTHTNFFSSLSALLAWFFVVVFFWHASFPINLSHTMRLKFSIRNVGRKWHEIGLGIQMNNRLFD